MKRLRRIYKNGKDNGVPWWLPILMGFWFFCSFWVGLWGLPLSFIIGWKLITMSKVVTQYYRERNNEQNSKYFIDKWRKQFQAERELLKGGKLEINVED